MAIIIDYMRVVNIITSLHNINTSPVGFHHARPSSCHITCHHFRHVTAIIIIYYCLYFTLVFLSFSFFSL